MPRPRESKSELDEPLPFEDLLLLARLLPELVQDVPLTAAPSGDSNTPPNSGLAGPALKALCFAARRGREAVSGEWEKQRAVLHPSATRRLLARLEDLRRAYDTIAVHLLRPPDVSQHPSLGDVPLGFATYPSLAHTVCPAILGRFRELHQDAADVQVHQFDTQLRALRALRDPDRRIVLALVWDLPEGVSPPHGVEKIDWKEEKCLAIEAPSVAWLACSRKQAARFGFGDPGSNAPVRPRLLDMLSALFAAGGSLILNQWGGGGFTPGSDELRKKLMAWARAAGGRGGDRHLKTIPEALTFRQALDWARLGLGVAVAALRARDESDGPLVYRHVRDDFDWDGLPQSGADAPADWEKVFRPARYALYARAGWNKGNTSLSNGERRLIETAVEAFRPGEVEKWAEGAGLEVADGRIVHDLYA